jgi:RND family efflux transporter MFP subunit
VGQIYVRQGQIVEPGAPLVRLVPGPKTTASYAQAKSALNVASQLVERTRKLLGGHLATDQQLADALKTESDARSELAAMEAQGAAGPHILAAPFRAIVTGITGSAGSIVSEGSALLDLAKPDGLVLQVGVVPEQAAAIEAGEKVKIMPLGGEPVSGEVLMRGSIVDATNGMVSVDIRLPAGKFLLGQMASAAITTGETQGYIVPHEAILVDDKGKTYVMQAVDLVAKKVSVRVLDSNGEKDVIDGKLNDAAPVVLAGNHQLDDGTKVHMEDATDKADEDSREKADPAEKPD